jgi:soluble lytic murein transglycosylase
MKKGRKKRVLLLLLAVFIAAALWSVSNYDTLRHITGDVVYDHHSFDSLIKKMAAKHGLDSRLIKALIYQESRFNPNRKGKAGEIGLMQILPRAAVADWARVTKSKTPYTFQLYNPELNLEIGCWYLGKALHRWQEYSDNIELALAQYNAGGSRANRWKPEKKDGKLLPRVTLASTKKYISQITKRYRNYLK